MSLCLMDVHGDIEGDYEFVCDIPNGTNGEVIQALFDGLVIHDNPAMQKYTIPMTYDFWNAPYQKGGE